MRVVVIHGIGDLARDLREIPVQVSAGTARVTGRRAVEGAKRARGFARITARAHGKHYPDAIDAEPITPHEWEFGPDASKDQGGMSFEWGSRNQKPHRDLNNAADIVAPAWRRDIGDVLDKAFW